MKTILALLILIFPAMGHGAPVPLTPFEASGGKKTPRYQETMAWLEEISQSNDQLRLTSFGTSPQGRSLPLIIADKQARFSPQEHQDRRDEVVLLVQACIHAGESCGKDAGMLLLRDLATDPALADQLLDKVTLLFIPIFNVDGHERFGPYNRINQNGPDEMGWRVTAQNQNLNRDYLKADLPEMRAWLSLYQQWLPDFFIDIHSTDGADYQYAITYGLETHGNMDPSLTDWTIIYRDAMNEAMTGIGYPLAPYVSFRQWHDPRSGLVSWAAGPRFSQGYTALQNRPGLLIETHMLKDYAIRVDAARQMVIQTMGYLNQQAADLRHRVLAADQRTASPAFRQNPFALSFKLTENHHRFEFLGVSYEKVSSEITGGDWFRFSDQPETMSIELYDEMEPDKTVQLPAAYLIPPEWTVVIDRLKWHGVALRRLEKPMTLEVSTYRFSQAHWREKPYEGHHPVSFQVEPLVMEREFPAGTVVVDMNQRAARVAAHLLEPEGPDSMVRWGYLDAAFERVEYVESYVIERMIPDMIRQDPSLVERLEAQKEKDPQLAGDPGRIRDWFYRQTKYYDQRVNLYPISLIRPQSIASEIISGTILDGK